MDYIGLLYLEAPFPPVAAKTFPGSCSLKGIFIDKLLNESKVPWNLLLERRQTIFRFKGSNFDTKLGFSRENSSVGTNKLNFHERPNFKAHSTHRK